MRRLVLACGVLVVTCATAVADDLATVRWPGVPAATAPSMGDQILDHLDDLGDRLGNRLDRVSDHVLTLQFDTHHNRAWLGIGSQGDGHYLQLRVDSNWLFSQGQAHVDATVHLGLGAHRLDLKLPTMNIVPDSWHGQDLVVVDFNLLQRRF